MAFTKKSKDGDDLLDHNFLKGDGEEKNLSDIADPCRAIVYYHGSEITITSKEAPLPKIDSPKLSIRESEVLHYLADGFSPDQAALKMGIKVRTVRKFLYKLEVKFNTCSRDQLMARAGYLRLCDPYRVVDSPSD